LDRILKGNLAPGGAVAKITGKEGLSFTGKARAFDSEDDFVKAVESGSIKQGEKTVVVLRYLGPKGGPGMPEMLKPTSLIMGAGLGYDVASLTDGRFSGGYALSFFLLAFGSMLMLRWQIARILHRSCRPRSPSRRTYCAGSGWRYYFH
jgi:dihydroxyacid dehydratase/phosphogluconate dehydratase